MECQKKFGIENQAELLPANLHIPKKGITEAELLGLCYSPLKKKVTLDPRLSPKEMLQKTFL